MSILNPTDFPINPSTTTGTDLADRLNRFEQAAVTTHANTARPAYLQAGGLWVKLAGGGMHLMFFDGTTDFEIGSVTSGVGSFGSSALAPAFNPGLSYAAGTTVYDPTSQQYLTAKAAISAGALNLAQWDASATPIGNMYTKAQVDAAITGVTNQLAKYVLKAGDTMTGALVVNSTIRATGEISTAADITAFKP